MNDGRRYSVVEAVKRPLLVAGEHMRPTGASWGKRSVNPTCRARRVAVQSVMETTRRDEVLRYMHIRERDQLPWRELSDIPIATLQWWQRKLREEAADAFVEIPVRVAESEAFFAIEVGDLRVRIANGLRIGSKAPDRGLGCNGWFVHSASRILVQRFVNQRVMELILE